MPISRCFLACNMPWLLVVIGSSRSAAMVVLPADRVSSPAVRSRHISYAVSGCAPVAVRHWPPSQVRPDSAKLPGFRAMGKSGEFPRSWNDDKASRTGKIIQAPLQDLHMRAVSSFDACTDE